MATMTEIKQSSDHNMGLFTAYVNGKEAGTLSYKASGNNRIIIDHTEVSKDFNGQGIGKKLVMHAVEYARENNLKILPVCPFAKSVFEKTESISDVLF